MLGLKDLGAGAAWHLQPSCAITGDGLEEGLARLQEMIVGRRRKPSSSSGGHPAARKGLKKAGSNPKLGSGSRKLHRSHSHVC